MSCVAINGPLELELGYPVIWGTKTDLKQAQLSQRDRAMLRVTEYYAKSLKVIENDAPFERIAFRRINKHARERRVKNAA